MDVALDNTMLLVRELYCFADAHRTIAGDLLQPPMPLPTAVAASPHVQWLLSCHVAMTAQSLHKQQKGRSLAVPLTPGSSSSGGSSCSSGSGSSGGSGSGSGSGSAWQQHGMKVAAVHKRLLEGLGVPRLLGVNYCGQGHLGIWAKASAYPAIIACYFCDCKNLYGDGSSSTARQQSSSC
jgi:hypothetical protein